MRVLMLEGLSGWGTYQTKLEAIARWPDVELVAVVPPSWDDPSSRTLLERRHTEGYELLVAPIRFNGRYHTYYFPDLPQRLARHRPDIVHIDEEPYNLATWLAMRQARAVGAGTLFFSWQNLERRYPPPFQSDRATGTRRHRLRHHGQSRGRASGKAKGYRGPHPRHPAIWRRSGDVCPTARARSGPSFHHRLGQPATGAGEGRGFVAAGRAELPGVWRFHIAGDGLCLPDLRQLAADLGIAGPRSLRRPRRRTQLPAYLATWMRWCSRRRPCPIGKSSLAGSSRRWPVACRVIGSRSRNSHVIGDAALLLVKRM